MQATALILLKYCPQQVELSPMDHHGAEVTVGPLQLVAELDDTLIEERPRPGGSPAGSPGKMIVPPVPEWPRLGASNHPAGAALAEPEEAEHPTDPVDSNLEIEDGDTTLFEAAIGAFHAGEYQRAESLFLEEAQRTVDAAPQRAAISYRQAALAAGQMGNSDASDHWMRLAGREYLRVTEDDRTPLPFIREAAVMAAKCFLSVENLKVASKGLRRAQAIETVLRADDDLMAESTGARFDPRPEEVDEPADRRAPAGSGDDASPGAVTVAPVPAVAPVVTEGTVESGPPATPTAGPGPHGGWLHRLRHSRPTHPVA
ncbi:MAG TPA: hypothetical protein VII46_08215 [Acidimicrobiales bacterium]